MNSPTNNGNNNDDNEDVKDPATLKTLYTDKQTDSVNAADAGADTVPDGQIGGEEAKQLSRTDTKRRELMLNANIWKVVLVIAFPLMLVNALQYLYTIIDSMMAAKIGATAVSTVVVLTQINNMLAALGTSLASGGMIIISRLVGRRDFALARKIANTLIVLAVIVAAVTTGIIIPLAAPILRLIGTSEAFISQGVGYFSLQLVTTGIMLFNNIFLGLEKARGQTKNIMLLNMGVMVIKIILSYLFIYVFSFGLVMISAATLIANFSLTVYVVIRILMPKYTFRFSFKNKDLSFKFLKPIIVLSFPIFLGRFVFSLGKVIINGMCAHYGDNVVGALGVSNNMGGYVTNVLGSAEESSSLIISVNLGQKNQARALKAFWYSSILILSIAVLGVILLTVLNDPIVRFYATGNGEYDAEFARMISDIFRFEKIGIIALGINSSVLGLLYGFGYTRISAFVNLSRLFVFRIPTLWILMEFSSLGWQSVGIAMMVSNVGIGLMSVVIGALYLIKIKRNNITDDLKIGT